MLYTKNVNWNDLPTSLKRGRCIIKNTYDLNGNIRTKWEVDNEIPLFNEDKNYIEKYL